MTDWLIVILKIVPVQGAYIQATESFYKIQVWDVDDMAMNDWLNAILIIVPFERAYILDTRDTYSLRFRYDWLIDSSS
jgi:hypothetical protein